MLHSRAMLLLVAPLLVAVGAIDPAAAGHVESVAFKCRNSVQKEPLFFLDGRASTDAAFKALNQNDVLSVEVVCMRAVDSTKLVMASAEPGIGAISIWTRFSPYPHLKPTLEAVQVAQRAHHARTGSYTSDRSALSLPALPSEVRLTLNSSGDSWNATVWIDRRLSPECRMYEGAPPKATVETKGYVFCS